MGYNGNTCHNNKLGLYLYTTARLNRLLFLLVCQAKLKKGEDNGHGKSYNSWLAWWRSTITTDDFLKFLSTQVTASQALVLVPSICGFVAYSFRFGVRFLALDLVLCRQFILVPQCILCSKSLCRWIFCAHGKIVRNRLRGTLVHAFRSCLRRIRNSCNLVGSCVAIDWFQPLLCP